MVSGLRRAVAVLLMAGALTGGEEALAATVDDEREAEKGRFAFSLAITSGVLIAQQNGDIDLQALDIVDPPRVVWRPKNPTPSLPPFLVIPTTRPEPFLTPTSGSVNAISPNIGLSFEVMSPSLDLLPADPRFFVSGEILPTFASETTVALQGAATEFRIPEQALDTFRVEAIAGTGSRLRARVMTTVVAVNAGAAFAFEVRERLLRFKPSVGWIRWGVVARGNALAAYKNDPVTLPPGAPFYGPELRLVSITGRGSGFFHAVEPATPLERRVAELEMELGKRGPLRPVLYLGTFAYRTVGNDTISFKGSSGPIVDWFNTPGSLATGGVFGPDEVSPATYAGDWTFRVDPWSYRVFLGVRLRWVGH